MKKFLQRIKNLQNYKRQNQKQDFETETKYIPITK